MKFREKLEIARKKNNSLLCVGLDPDPVKISRVMNGKKPIFEFNRRIIDSTFDLVSAYKPQMAHYSAQRAEDQLEETIEYVKSNYPHIPVILDAKRGDIDSTAEWYAKEAFDRYGADAVTVNPYLGTDSLMPFLERGDKGVIVLCKTSNPGSPEIQDLKLNGMRLFEHIATLAVRNWDKNGNVCLVVGATYAEDMKLVRQIVGDMDFLVPGIGSQGGAVETVIRNGLNSRNAGLIVSASRSILYKASNPDFHMEARNEARLLRDKINSIRDRVPG